MQVRTEDVGPVRIVRIIVTAVDASNAAELGARLKEETTDHRRLVLDLSQTGNVDSDGLAALCASWRSLRSRGIHLTLCGLPPRCRLAARLLRLDEVLMVFDDLTDALDAHGVSLPAPELPELALS